MACILIASPAQRENESTYYREIVGFEGDFLFAENLEEARILVISGKGVMPIEGGEAIRHTSWRIPLPDTTPAKRQAHTPEILCFLEGR